MKGRGTSLILAAGILFGLLPNVLVGAETGVQPPDVSYSDQWADLEEQSTPFLDLRNDSPGGRITTPEAPDTPGVEVANVDGETVVVKAPTSEETSDTQDEAQRESADTVAGPVGREDTAVGEVAQSDTESTTDPEDEVSDTEPQRATTPDTEDERRMAEESGDSDSPDQTTRSSEEVRGEPTPESGDRTGSAVEGQSDSPGVSKSSKRSPDRITGSFFSRTSPLDTGPVLFRPASIDSGIPSGTVATGKVQSDFDPLSPVKYPRSTVPFWWQYYWWIVGGLVVTVTIGMFFWFRRRRVEVVDSSYPSADTFFQEQLKRKRNPVTPKEPERPAAPQDTSTGPSGRATSAPSTSSDVGFNHRKLAERLREKGYEGEFEQMLKLYYEENMTEEEIAERISRGTGAVGLVLDYADRLRKEMDHGKRA